MSRLVALLLVSALGAACAHYNMGELSAASSETVPVPMITIREEAKGSACGDLLAQRLETAVEDALRNSPGANALVDASFHFERLCLVVRGRAVQIP
jgi:hypothetical protein